MELREAGSGTPAEGDARSFDIIHLAGDYTCAGLATEIGQAPGGHPGRAGGRVFRSM